MSGSECLGWRSEFGICNQSTDLGFGQKLLNVRFFRDWDDAGILSL